jgi:hypothetical protein
MHPHRLKWSFGEYQERTGARAQGQEEGQGVAALHATLAATSLLGAASSSSTSTSAATNAAAGPAAVAAAPAFVPPVIAPFTLRHCVPLYAHPYSARVLECLPAAHSILLSKAAAASNHGVLRLNLADPAFQHFLPLHKASIRDIAVTPGTGTHMLTCSLDRSLILTSLSSNKACHAFALEAPGWSCCFDATDPNYLYAGLANNTILTYDVRVPDHPVHRITGDARLGGVGKAIHSLRSVVDGGSGYRGLLGGSMNAMFLVHDGAGHGPYRGAGEGANAHVAARLASPAPGYQGGVGAGEQSTGDSCFSAGYDAASGHWLSSWRSRSGTTHHVGTLRRGEGEGEGAFSLQCAASLASPHVSASLTRSSLLSGCGPPAVHSAEEEAEVHTPLLVLSGEVPGSLQVWRGSWQRDPSLTGMGDGQSTVHFPAAASEPLAFRSTRPLAGGSGAVPPDAGTLMSMDIKPCRIGGPGAPPLLAALTHSHLFVYETAEALLLGSSRRPAAAPSAPATFSCRL